MSQTERLYWLDAEIRAGRYPNAASHCEKFEISRRTAYEDRDKLGSLLGTRLKHSRTHGGWTYGNRNFVLPFLALSEAEARSLSRSLLAAREYLGPAEAQPVERLIAKLGEYVPAALPGSSESVGGSIRSSADVSVSAQLLDDCAKAIRCRQRIDLQYYSAHRDRTKDRIVRPYHLHNHQGEWHMIAWCEWREALRQFYLGLIQHHKLLPGEGSYVIPSNFDAEDYLAKGFGTRHGESLVTIRLLFSAWQARWIRERTYHSTQQTEEMPDGRLEVTFQIAGTQEILRWILGYGPDVEVLEPKSLRQEVTSRIEKTAKIYGAN